MATRTTISLDDALYAKLKHVIKSRGMNQFVNEALWEKIQRIEQEHVENRMKVGYLATKSERVRLNEDWQTVDVQGWPE